MNYVIFEQGGKQYKAVEGEFVEVDRLPLDIGSKVDLDQVVLVSDEKGVQVGKPFVQGAKIKAKVEDHFKGPKIIVFKYRPRQRYRVKSGHRQSYTRLKIEKIAVNGKKGKEDGS